MGKGLAHIINRQGCHTHRRQGLHLHTGFSGKRHRGFNHSTLPFDFDGYLTILQAYSMTKWDELSRSLGAHDTRNDSRLENGALPGDQFIPRHLLQDFISQFHHGLCAGRAPGNLLCGNIHHFGKSGCADVCKPFFHCGDSPYLTLHLRSVLADKLKFSQNMISVAEAYSIIQAHLFKPGVETVDLKASCGRSLAEAVTADRDLPPFDRVSMDGIAIAHAAFQKGTRHFKIEGIQAAGMPPMTLPDTSGCIEVMTGASLPLGTDTVIRYEDTTIMNQEADIRVTEIKVGQNIHRRGRDAQANQELLLPGIEISPAEVNLLASVGLNSIPVFKYPKTAIISTGDELVDVNMTPLPHQIRRSNDAALEAAFHEMGCTADKFHLTDDAEILEKKMRDILDAYDLIILSGGVSKGKFDLIPQVLETIGVRKLFHQVGQKPGKPFWFGISAGKTVFALPGNPVSTYLCFYKYVKPWLIKSMRMEIPVAHAVLARDFAFNAPLTYFLQVRVSNEQGKMMAWPVEGGGSGDFANLRGVNGFLEFPAERNEFRAGEVFPLIPFRK